MFIPEKHHFKSFDKLLFLATPTPHRKPGTVDEFEELDYIKEAFTANWLTTEGANVREVERLFAELIGMKYAVGLSCGTAAIHLAVKLAGVKPGDKVACSDMTFDATVNPVAYEKGQPVFIDTEYDTWNMDPAALEKAFEIYPEIKVVILAHLYGTPAKVGEIKEICRKHNAVLIEDAAESLGATYRGKQTGSFGDIGCISFNGNKIITGSSGGMLLSDDKEQADRARKWSTQSREDAPWYQHEELGYNYRMSNIIAGMVRGQVPHLQEHIAQKKVVWERYRDAFSDLPMSMSPVDFGESKSNYWLSCVILDRDAMCRQVRNEWEALYTPEHGKSCPTEILERLMDIKAQGRPIWKPMHLQPIYQKAPFITREGREGINAFVSGEGRRGRDGKPLDVGMDIFHRGLCLPSDNKMTEEQQDRVIQVVRACFE